MVGVIILALSFCVTLYVIDLATDQRRVELQREVDEVALAQARGIAAGGDVRVYSLSAENGGSHTAERAFVGARSPDRFWEAEGGFPINLIVLFPAARAINEYALRSGEVVDRMPSSWMLEGSPDGFDWFPLDKEGPVPRWGANETRTYRLAMPQPATLLRFRFAGAQDQKILRIYGIELR
jgi:hypothetical protein